MCFLCLSVTLQSIILCTNINQSIRTKFLFVECILRDNIAYWTKPVLKSLILFWILFKKILLLLSMENQTWYFTTFNYYCTINVVVLFMINTQFFPFCVCLHVFLTKEFYWYLYYIGKLYLLSHNYTPILTFERLTIFKHALENVVGIIWCAFQYVFRFSPCPLTGIVMN